jgi:gluconolactonase
MFAPPKEIATEVWTTMPDSLRLKSRPSEWARIRHHDAHRFDCFLEGPSFDRDGNLYVTDIPHGRVLKISPDAQWSVAAEYDGAPNGLKIRKDGMIFIADSKWGIMQLDPRSGDVTPVCLRYGYEPFRGLNDLVFDSRGNLYFTDQSNTDLRDPTGRVFRLTPEGKLDCLIDNVPSPTGLVLAPDEKALFLAVTRANCVWHMPFGHDGGLARVGLYIQLSGSAGGGPDGLAMDEGGNLSVCHVRMGSVWVFDPLGEPLYRIRSCKGLGVTNLAYGGPDRRELYITEMQSGSVLRARMPVSGKAMYSHM